MMKLIPADDYYLWFCEWCDSQNRTLWTRMDAHHLTCGVCSRRVAVNASPSSLLLDVKERSLATPSL